MRSQRLFSKRALHRPTARLRLLALMESVERLVPDTYSECGVTSGNLSCFLSSIRSSNNLRPGGLLTRLKGLPINAAIAQQRYCVHDLKGIGELPRDEKGFSKTVDEVICGCGWLCMSVGQCQYSAVSMMWKGEGRVYDRWAGLQSILYTVPTRQRLVILG